MSLGRVHTYIDSGVRHLNFGDEPIIRIRSVGTERGLISFDTGDIRAAAGDREILAATLQLDVSMVHGFGSRSRILDLHRMTDQWTEMGATWACSNDTDTSNFWADCSFSERWWMLVRSFWPFLEAPTASVTVSGSTTGNVDFNVTSDIEAFLSGGSSNYGWILRKHSELLAGWIEFGSRESANPPVLLLSLAIESCDNGVDDDLDGLADCDDPDCAFEPICTLTCGNGTCELTDCVACLWECGTGVCGVICSDDGDDDGDGVLNCEDGCPTDPLKVAPGLCDCGTDDTDSDGDGTPDCQDGCPFDAGKVEPGVCLCGRADHDFDADGTPNCVDLCPVDRDKTEPGACGCGVPDDHSDDDDVPDCDDLCPLDPDKTDPGVCGCGTPDDDTDEDGVLNCNELCDFDPDKIEPGVCGCGTPDNDEDNNCRLDCDDDLQLCSGGCECPGSDYTCENRGDVSICVHWTIDYHDWDVIGQNCDEDPDCQTGPKGSRCLSEDSTGFKDGYCSGSCTGDEEHPGDVGCYKSGDDPFGGLWMHIPHDPVDLLSVPQRIYCNSTAECSKFNWPYVFVDNQAEALVTACIWPTDDAWISSEQPSDNLNDTEIVVGYGGTASGLVHFAQDEIDAMSNGVLPETASLSLYSENHLEAEAELYRLLVGWNERDVTWLNPIHPWAASPVYPGDNPNAYYHWRRRELRMAAEPTFSPLVLADEDFSVVSVKADVIGFINESYESEGTRFRNHGWQIWPSADSSAAARIRSSEAEFRLRPRLCLTFKDEDSDGDNTPDHEDECRYDPDKVVAGQCGCGNPETDSDSNGVPDCVERCGDGHRTTLGGGEDCDAGNTYYNHDDSGCDECRISHGWECERIPDCDPETEGCGCEVCAPAGCGDGDVAAGYWVPGTIEECCDWEGVCVPGERCDDGNNDANDGCSSSCQVEPNWTCFTAVNEDGPDSECYPRCGDGRLNRGEECDDGDGLEPVRDGDGCSSTCTFDVHWVCDDPSCGDEYCCGECGDGVQVGREECDDGNTDPDDGCDENCKVELPCDGGPINACGGCADLGGLIPGGSCGSCGYLFCASEDVMECFDTGAALCDGCDVTTHCPVDPPLLEPPEVDPTRPLSFTEATQFVYSGDDAIQEGIDPGKIDGDRVAVIRGRVMRRDGTGMDPAPLSGIKISVTRRPGLSHTSTGPDDEFGYTYSRADGEFHIAVNGGARYTVRYESPGYITVDRNVTAVAHSYVWADDVVMTPYSTPGERIVLGLGHDAVVEGDTEDDDDGQRTARLYFDGDTTAEMILPDGRVVPLPSLTVRLTEFTVGAQGQAAMPAPLPFDSMYTYALEISADEAIRAGAVEVRLLGQPAQLYLENFTGFDERYPIPNGYYDRELRRWVAAESGYIIIIGETDRDGRVAVWRQVWNDLNGDQKWDPDTEFVLTDISEQFSNDERWFLQRTYSEGDRVWRTPIRHFTPFDLNLAWILMGFLTEIPIIEWLQENLTDEPTYICSSIIEVENRNVGECVPLGDATSLQPTICQFSNRTAPAPGVGEPLRIEMGVTPSEERDLRFSRVFRIGEGGFPDAVGAVRVRAEVAGHAVEIEQSTDEIHYEIVTVTWDGTEDGRTVPSMRDLTLRVAYGYEWTPAPTSSFGRASNQVLSACADPDARCERDGSVWWVETSETVPIGRVGSQVHSLGGWSIANMHVYDPTTQHVVLGTGGTYESPSVANVIETVAGPFYTIQDDPESRKLRPIAMAPAGGDWYYVSLVDLDLEFAENNRIVLVDPDGGVWPVTTGDEIRMAYGLAVGPDGSLYITDVLGHRVFRWRADGSLSVIAGTGVPGHEEGDGPALEKPLFHPGGIVVDQDTGTVFVSDGSWTGVGQAPDEGNHCIRRIEGDTMYTHAGDCGNSGDTVGEESVLLYHPGGLALDDHGDLLIADQWNHRIIRVETGGSTSVAFGEERGGCPGPELGADPGVVLDRLCFPGGVAVHDSGAFYVTDWYSNRLLLVDAVEAQLVAGDSSGRSGFEGDHGSPANARLWQPLGITIGEDGAVYLADQNNLRVRRIAPRAFARSEDGEYQVPSQDGSQIFVFSQHGRHERTLDAVLGTVLVDFEYENDLPTALEYPHGRRVDITHDTNRITLRDSFGNSTVLDLDLGSVGAVTWGGETTQFDYVDDLLTVITRPDGREQEFAYDPDFPGRLESDEGPTNSSLTFQYETTDEGYEVEMTTAEGQTQSFEVVHTGAGETRRRTTAIDTDSVHELTVETSTISDGIHETRTVQYPDGTETTAILGRDARFGAQVQRLESLTVVTPSGRRLQTNFSREQTSRPDGLSLASLTDTVQIVGGTGVWETSFVNDGTSSSLTMTTPEARTTLVELDSFGRATRILPPDFNEGTDDRHLEQHFTYDGSHLVSIESRVVDDEGMTVKSRIAEFQFDLPDDGRLDRVIDPYSRRTELDYSETTGRLESLTAPGDRTTTFDLDIEDDRATVTTPGAEEPHVFDLIYPDEEWDRDHPQYPFNDFDYPDDLEVGLVSRYTPPHTVFDDPGDDGRSLSASDRDGRPRYWGRGDYRWVQTFYDDDGLSRVVYLDGRTETGEGVEREFVIVPTCDGHLHSITRRDAADAPDSGCGVPVAGELTIDFDTDGLLPLGQTWSGSIEGQVGYDYDGLFRRSEVSVNGDAVSYDYDNDNLLADAGAMEIERYTQSGLVKTTTLGELVTEYTYTDFGELDTQEAYLSGGTPDEILDDTELFYADYTYDDLGRIVQITERIENNPERVEVYEYDEAGRLWKVRAENGIVIIEYQYDQNGNRTKVLDGAGNDLEYPINHDRQDRLTAYGDTHYFYNNHGELERTAQVCAGEYCDQTEYDYDVFGNLRRVAFPDGTEVTYEIDPLGRRVRREENGSETQRLLWDGQLRPVAELSETGAVETRYVYGLGVNVPDYYVREGVTYRIITDHLGSPRMIVQVDGPAPGRIVFRRDYDAWGKIEEEEIIEDIGEIPFGYAGGLYDETTGLVRFGFRDYDPRIGRWTAKDPIGFGGGDTNWYAYVGNDPVNWVDVWGLEGLFDSLVDTWFNRGLELVTDGLLVRHTMVRSHQLHFHFREHRYSPARVQELIQESLDYARAKVGPDATGAELYDEAWGYAHLARPGGHPHTGPCDPEDILEWSYAEHRLWAMKRCAESTVGCVGTLGLSPLFNLAKMFVGVDIRADSDTQSTPGTFRDVYHTWGGE